jgi:hypothetical protein
MSGSRTRDGLELGPTRAGKCPANYLVSQVGPALPLVADALFAEPIYPASTDAKSPLGRPLYFCANILPATRVNEMYDALTALTITRKK